MSDKDTPSRVTLGRLPVRRDVAEVAQAGVPARGRHRVGLARVPLRRIAVVRGQSASPAKPAKPRRRVDRRREQMPLPPGFVDRRRAA